MANIEEVNGAFGGVKIEEGAQKVENTSVVAGGSNLPTKTGFWNKVKAILFYDVKIELTPYQQKIEDELNDFLYQEITWAKVKDFLFQEVTFGKKKNK